MNINEIKHRNLLRLCRKFNCEEPTRLAVILGSSKQHASQLLKDKSKLGNNTISKLCEVWKISPDEFIQTKLKEEPAPENKLSWEVKAIIDGMQKQIDLQSTNIKTLENRIDAQGKILLVLQKSCDDINKKLIHAASKGDVSLLG